MVIFVWLGVQYWLLIIGCMILFTLSLARRERLQGWLRKFLPGKLAIASFTGWNVILVLVFLMLIRQLAISTSVGNVIAGFGMLLLLGLFWLRAISSR